MGVGCEITLGRRPIYPYGSMGGIVEPIYVLKLQVVISSICKKKVLTQRKKTTARKQIEIVLTLHKKTRAQFLPRRVGFELESKI